MATKQAVHFNTSAFQFAHGKQPRGIGSWAFKAIGTSKAGREAYVAMVDMDLFWFNGSFSAAKAAARAHFATLGVALVEVCS